MVYSAAELLEQTSSAFLDIGYNQELVRKPYRFADFLSEAYEVREIPMAGFANYPPSYRTSGFGVIISDSPNGRNESLVADFRALGAPHLFIVNDIYQEVYHWSTASREPIFLETIKAERLFEKIRSKRDEWGPENVLRAKAIGSSMGAKQLDFYDIGLLPVIEHQVNSKLDELFGRTLTVAKSLHKNRNDREMFPREYQSLFRLVFRLVAAKLLADREHPGTWLFQDVESTLRAVEGFYFQTVRAEPIFLETEIQQAVWDTIRHGFHLENLSLEALAYVYEHTFVTEETRLAYGTHATPSEIAEFVVQQLPLENLEQNERLILEPFTGHAPFLISALGRLRDLLPSTLSISERHHYFTSMLKGIELDSFAREIARYSLILADYPNANGWQIVSADAFEDLALQRFVDQVNVVLCNPPFGDFSQEERKHYPDLRSASKPVHILLEILEHPPKMLGVIVPRTFVDGQSYGEVRRKLADTYETINITALPDNVFRHSRAETAVVTASGYLKQDGYRIWTRAFVSREDYSRFRYSRKATWQYSTSLSGSDIEGIQLWESPLERHLLDHLAKFPRLASVAEIHRGIEYKNKVEEHISKEPLPGYKAGLHNVEDGLRPYVIDGYKYLDLNSDVMLYKAYELPWNLPKVIANAARISSSTPWRIVAAPDRSGLYCYQRFHGIWSTKGVPIELIAAVLNGPVANALLSSSASSRDNLIKNVAQIPLPMLHTSELKLLVSLVSQYVHMQHDVASRKKSLFSARQIMTAIDLLILSAYHLPNWIVQELLRYIGSDERPRVGISFIEQAYELHAALVDQKYLGNLSKVQLNLLDYVNYLLDIVEDDFYRPIRERLAYAAKLIGDGHGIDHK